jgi:hypothetical protein
VVTAIDISPGAIQVSRRRGVEDARLLPLALVDAELGSFDTVLMMCGNFGLAGTSVETDRFLRLLRDTTPSSARIILDTVDPYAECDEADLAYHARNEERGRLPGQVTIRIRYGGRVTPWFELLTVSPAELEALAGGAGWRVTQIARDGSSPDYYACLEKA